MEDLHHPISLILKLLLHLPKHSTTAMVYSSTRIFIHLYSRIVLFRLKRFYIFKELLAGMAGLEPAQVHTTRCTVTPRIQVTNLYSVIFLNDFTANTPMFLQSGQDSNLYEIYYCQLPPRMGQTLIFSVILWLYRVASCLRSLY